MDETATRQAWERKPFRMAIRTARDVKSADAHDDLLRALRPRIVPGLLRDNDPLALRLFAAHLEGRLEVVAGAVAILDPPQVRGAKRPGKRSWARYLGIAYALLSWWPALVPLVLVLGVLPFRDDLPMPWIKVAAELLVYLVICYEMGCYVLVQGYRLYRQMVVVTDRAVVHDTVSKIMVAEWSVSLLHAASGQAAHAVLRRCLATVDASVASVHKPPLVVRRRAITTLEARAATADHAGAIPFSAHSTTEVIVVAPGRASQLQAPESPVRRPVRILPGILALVLVVLAVNTWLVITPEHAACASSECTGRPATIPTALYWLTERLMNHDTDGIAAQTWAARLVGVGTSLLGWFIFGIGLTSAFNIGIRRLTSLPTELIETFNAAHLAPSVDTDSGGDTKDTSEGVAAGGRANKTVLLAGAVGLMAVGAIGYATASRAVRSHGHGRLQS